LRIVRAYLEVERLRLGAKLRVEIDVAPEALSAPIPILSIQPLVENAVKHGIAPKPDGGTVRLQASIEAGALQVVISDTGGGFAAQKSDGAGVGLDNVSRRLQLCYGATAKLAIETGRDGSRVSFSIPLAQPIPASVVGAVR
jgi:two-component system, LytTR family, sensor kinase